MGAAGNVPDPASAVPDCGWVAGAPGVLEIGGQVDELLTVSRYRADDVKEAGIFMGRFNSLVR